MAKAIIESGSVEHLSEYVKRGGKLNPWMLTFAFRCRKYDLFRHLLEQDIFPTRCVYADIAAYCRQRSETPSLIVETIIADYNHYITNSITDNLQSFHRINNQVRSYYKEGIGALIIKGCTYAIAQVMTFIPLSIHEFRQALKMKQFVIARIIAFNIKDNICLHIININSIIDYLECVNTKTQLRPSVINIASADAELWDLIDDNTRMAVVQYNLVCCLCDNNLLLATGIIKTQNILRPHQAQPPVGVIRDIIVMVANHKNAYEHIGFLSNYL
jgi:hypothetical protein